MVANTADDITLDSIRAEREPTSLANRYGSGNAQSVLRSPLFLSDLRAYFRSQNVNVGGLNDDELIDRFYSDRNWADLNTVGAVSDARSAYRMGEEDRARARHLQEVWRQLPGFMGEGGRGWAAVPDIATALIADPVNLIGGVAGKAAATTAARGAIQAGRTTGQATRAGLRAGVSRAALSEGAIGGATEAGVDVATQSRDVSLGLQEGYSPGQTAVAAGAGALLGGAAGGLTGVPAALVGAREGAERTTRLLPPPEETTEPGAPAPAAEPLALPSQQILERDRLAEMVEMQRARYDAARTDGLDEDTVAEEWSMLQRLRQLRPFHERLKTEAEQITALEASNEPAKLKEARRRSANFEQAYADFRVLFDGYDDETADTAIQRLRERLRKIEEEEVASAGETPGQAETQTERPAEAREQAGQAAAGEEPAPTAEEQAEAAAARAVDPATATPTPDADTPTATAEPEGWANTNATESAIDLAMAEGLEPGDVTPNANGRITVLEVRRARNARAQDAPTPTGTVTPEEPATPAGQAAARGPEGPQVAAKQQRAAGGTGGTAGTAAPTAPTVPPEAMVAWEGVNITATARKRAEAAGLTPDDLPETGSAEGGQIGAADVSAAAKVKRRVSKTAQAKTKTQPAQPTETPPSNAGRATPAEPGMAPIKAQLGERWQTIPDQVRREALVKGVDWRAEAGDKTAREAVASIRRAIRRKAAEPSEDDYNIRLRQAVEKAKRLAAEDEPETLDEATGLIQRLSEAEEFEEFGPDLVDYYRMQAEDAEGLGALDDAELPEAVDLTTTEQKKVRDLAGRKQTANPGLSREAAEVLATREVVGTRGRAADVGETRTAEGERTERASQLTTAGRTNAGKIQSFLRGGMPTEKGGDYTITERGLYPKKSMFSAEEAMLRAKAGENGGLVPFQAGGTERVKKKGVKASRVKRGTVIWTDGRDFYESQELYRYFRNDPKTPDPTPEATAEEMARQRAATGGDPTQNKKIARLKSKQIEAQKAVRTAKTEDKRAAAQAEVDRLTAELTALESPPVAAPTAAPKKKAPKTAKVSQATQDPTELKRGLEAKAAGKTPPETVPASDGERVLIIRNRENGQIRMLNPERQAGASLRTLLGKADPDNWDVKYAPADRHSSNQRVLQKVWDDIDDEASPASEGDLGAEAAAGPPNTPEGPPPRHYRDVSDQAIALSEEERAALGYGEAAEAPTVKALMKTAHVLETAKWGAIDWQTRTTGLRAAYGALSRAYPEGVMLPQATRQEAVEQARLIFQRYSPDEAAAAARFIARLGGNPEIGPMLGRAPEGSTPRIRTDYADEGAQVVELAPDYEVLTPRLADLYHEVAHWAYHNVLTDADRMEFWQAMQGMDEAKAAQLSPLPSAQNIEIKGKTHPVRTNALASPYELFANQFTAFAVRKEGGVAASGKYWSRIVGYVKAVFDRYVKGVAIDPRLEPLFAKILPDDAEAAEFRIREKRQPTQAGGKAALMRLSDARLAMEQMDEALARDSADGVINAAEEMHRVLRGLRQQRGTGAGSFAMTRRLTAIMDSRIRDLNTIFASEGVERKGLSEAAQQEGMSREFSPDERQKVADLLRDFWDNGYAGQFNPDYRSPKIKDIEATALKNSMGMVYNELELAFHKIEGAWPPGEKPASAKAFLEAKKSSAAGRKATTKRHRVYGAAKRSAEAEVKADPKKTKTSRKSEDIPADLKGMTETQLRKVYLQDHGTDRGRQAAQAWVAKIKSRPLPAKPVATDEWVKNARAPELEERLLDALHEGNKDVVDQVRWEMTRRATAKREGRVIPPVLRPKKPDVQKAIRREREDFIGIAEQDGIPPAAPATIRELLGYIEHRDPVINNTQRTLGYRMLNLLNRGAWDALEQANVMPMGQLARLYGADIDDASGAFVDFRHPAFHKARSDLRRMAIGLERGASPDTVVHEAAHVLVRALPDDERQGILEAYRATSSELKDSVARRYAGEVRDLDELAAEAKLAEEWWAEEYVKYLGERVALGDIYRQIETENWGDVRLRGAFGRAFDRMGEYLAYLFNGLIGRNDIKQQFRRLTFYGDMFEAPMQGPLHQRRRTSVPRQLAAGYAADALRSAPKTRKAAIRRFVSGGFGADAKGEPITFYHGTPRGRAFDRELNPDVALRPSERGNYGPGIYLSVDPAPADEVYSRRPTPEAMRQQIMEANPGLDDDTLADLYDDLMLLQNRRVLLSRKRLEYGEKLMGADSGDEVSRFLAMEEMPQLAEDIVELAEDEADLAEFLADWGAVVEPEVLPVHVQLRKPADFRRETRYDGSSALPAGVARALRNRGTLDDDGLDMLVSDLGAVDEITGAELYDTMVQAIRSGGRTVEDARRDLNATLNEMGYDGLLSTHGNVVSAGGAEFAPGQSLAGFRLEYTVPVVFDSRQVKHVDASTFDDSLPDLYRSRGRVPRGLNAAITEALADERIDSIDKVMAASVGKTVEDDNPGATGLSGALMSMLKGKTPSPRERATLLQNGPRGWLKSQSQNLDHLGMNWLSGWYEDLFPDVQQRFAQKFWPIHNELKKLPDAPGAMRAHAGRMKFWGSQPQPESHGKIVRALRRGDGSRQEKALTGDERRIYQMIRQRFAQEHDLLRKTGVLTGYRRNYVPQVWNPEAIRKDEAGFKTQMMEYARLEAEADGREFDIDEASEFADTVFAKLSEDNGTFIPEGGYAPVSGGGRNTRNDHTDFARMIKLDRPEYREALNGLEQYLESNLETLLVKYLDGSSRRQAHVDKLGVNSHALYDYMMVADQGAPGIARLLSTDRTFRKKDKVLNWEGVPETTIFSQTVRMPFANEGAATPFARKLVDIHRNDGSGAAREVLMDMAPRDARGEVPPAYARRADAIVGALDDYKGERAGFGAREVRYIEDANLVAMRKRRAGTLDLHARTSSNIRAFNSVTLLGFTTLTSLGDLALPLIRGGSFRDYSKAMRRFAQDPDYRDQIRRTGVALENVIQDRMVNLYGGGGGRFSNAFFNATMLTPWTELNRELAGAVGFEGMRTQQKRAWDAYREGVPLAQQSVKYKTAHRFLTSMGMQDFLPAGSRGKQMIDERMLGEDEMVRQAVIRFANQAIFAPNPNDIPLWAQTPMGAMAFQLKSFPLLMGKLAMHVVREAKQGNVKPLVYMASFGPALGAASLATKDIVQMRGGEDDQEAALRNRNLAKFAGYDEKVHGDVDDFWGWYAESFIQMGGVGLVADLLHGVAEQADNGAYGQTRVASMIFGPSAGTAFASVEVIGGVKEAIIGDETTWKERAGLRQVATRIPIIGGIRRAREGIVDAIVPEQDKGGWSSGDWGSGWSDSAW